jgi:hypothetical protein
VYAVRAQEWTAVNVDVHLGFKITPAVIFGIEAKVSLPENPMSNHQ